MSFKPFRLLIIILLSVATMATACGLRLGENDPPKEEIDLSGQFASLNQIDERVRKYFSGELEKEELKELFTAAQQALRVFKRDVRGEYVNGYKPEEISEFLTRHFLTKHNISESFLAEAMRFKQALLGGTRDLIAHKELDRLIEFFGWLGNKAEELRPYMAVYNTRLGLSHTRSQPMPDLDEASEVLKRVAGDLGGWLADAQASYPFDSMQAFVAEIRGLLNWEVHYQKVKPPEEWIELLKIFKSLTVKPVDHSDPVLGRERIYPGEWRALLVGGASWYAMQLKYTYHIAGNNIFFGESLDQFRSMVDDGFVLAKQALDAQQNNVITYAQLNELIDASSKLGFVPENMAGSLKVSLPVIANKVFGESNLKPDQRISRQMGLTRSMLAKAEAEFFLWADMQRHVDKKLRRSLLPKANQVLCSNDTMTSRPLSWLYASGNDCNDVYKMELARITENMRPLFRNYDPRVNLVSSAQSTTQNLFNLSMMNVYRGAMRLLIRGWSQNLERTRHFEGVTEDELESFYQDVKGLGFQLGLMDPRNKEVGRRAFIEGKSFPYRATGLSPKDKNDVLEFQEGLELVAYMSSAGVVQNKMHSDMVARCQPSGPLDIFGKAQVTTECFKQNLRDRIPSYLSNLPGMVAYIQRLSPYSKWKEMEQILLLAAKKPNEDASLIELSNMATIAMILHYVEAITTKYDDNNNGLLETDEIWEAYDIFKGLIEKLAAKDGLQLSERELSGVFAYILRHGKLPDRNSWWDKVRIVGESLHNWRLTLDRGKLTKIFSVLMRTQRGDADLVPPQEEESSVWDMMF